MNNTNILRGSLLSMAAMPVFAQGNNDYGHGHMWGSSGWFFGPIFMVLVVAIIVGLGVFLVKQAGGGGIHTSGHFSETATDTAMEILKNRLAKGEIDVEEYEQRRKVLES